MLKLEGRRCVVVGGGQVAARKIAGLIDAGALVTIISPTLNDPLTTLTVEHPDQITVISQSYPPGLLATLHRTAPLLLVFVATNSPVVNQAVTMEAIRLGLLVDNVDVGEDGNFSSMATLHRDSLTVAVNTGGAAPALTRHLKQRLEESIGEEYATFTRWMAEIRPQVREQITPAAKRAAFWKQLIDSSILDCLRHDNEDQARELLQALLDQALLDQVLLDQALPDPAMPDQTHLDQTLSGQMLLDEAPITPDDTEPIQIEPEQAEQFEATQAEQQPEEQNVAES
ncbi:MAG TPA: bifunctional precorrin-2 dehydrogenase/sirohydrochlorin ferrochelatase, partial [Phototrophicaceae bacterium]|nr:bifunctional precorrin-2 dehydrogenase/sirohydrochlorin ferrochelatase [Phototrophicaceae bacterium]